MLCRGAPQMKVYLRNSKPNDSLPRRVPDVDRSDVRSSESSELLTFSRGKWRSLALAPTVVPSHIISAAPVSSECAIQGFETSSVRPSQLVVAPGKFSIPHEEDATVCYQGSRSLSGVPAYSNRNLRLEATIVTGTSMRVADETSGKSDVFSAMRGKQ